MCKYSDDLTDYKCPHESLPENDYCIFHLQDDKKDIIEFNEGINKILETEKYSINFNGFYFPPKTTDFSKKQICGDIYFNNAIFSGNTDFVETVFSKNVDFSGAKFKTEVDFHRAIFTEEASFIETNFSNYAYFSKAKFLGKVYFHETVFLSKAFFRETIFEKDASFIEASFSDVKFYKTEFLGIVMFYDAKFSGVTDFDEAVFSCDVSFNKAVFYGETDLNCEFIKEVTFNKTQIHGKFIFIFNKSQSIDFKNAYFSDSVRIKGDLSKCYFHGSNIERVDMTDSIWIRNEETKKCFSATYKRLKHFFGLSDTSIIIWEESESTIASNLKELEGIYRRLKQAYQKYGDNSTAGKFYYQEMELKRKQLNATEKFFWTVFYKKFCGYGEKPFNVFWASLIITFLSALFYFFNGIEYIGSDVFNIPARAINHNLSFSSLDIDFIVENFNSSITDFIMCCYTSIITFTTLGYGDVRPIGLSRIVASIEAGLGIIMTALFIFVFTRRMLR